MDQKHDRNCGIKLYKRRSLIMLFISFRRIWTRRSKRLLVSTVTAARRNSLRTLFSGFCSNTEHTKKAGCLERYGKRKTETGLTINLYRLSIKAYLAVMLNTVDLEKFLETVSKQCIMTALAIFASKR